MVPYQINITTKVFLITFMYMYILQLYCNEKSLAQSPTLETIINVLKISVRETIFGNLIFQPGLKENVDEKKIVWEDFDLSWYSELFNNNF